MDHTQFLRARLDESDPGLPATELERIIVDLHVSSPNGSCDECELAWPCPRLLTASRNYVHHPDFPPDVPKAWAS